MARDPRSFKLSQDLWEAFKHLRQPGKDYSVYPSDNAALENLIAYMLKFRREHKMILSQLTLDEQDLVHAYIKWCVLNDIDDREEMPKPATAQDMLAQAKKWKASHGDGPPPKWKG